MGCDKKQKVVLSGVFVSIAFHIKDYKTPHQIQQSHIFQTILHIE